MGKRGEGWFVLQLVLLVIIALAPRFEGVAFPDGLRLAGWALLAGGGVFGLAALLQLGTNITPFPRPIAGGKLVTSGVYALVRHPIYAGLIVAAFGWALVRMNPLGVFLALLLLGFFDLKSRREEAWLMEVYRDYVDYRRRVKKLIPGIY